MTNILHVFHNEETNVKAFVTKGAKGFHVSMQDVDSGEFVAVVNIYPDEARAISKAMEIL